MPTNLNPDSFIQVKVKNRIFKNDDDTWFRMDLIVDIINKFFENTMIGADNTDTKVKISTFDITDVPACAHPALKSTNKNFIIPNQFAPRFTSKQESKNNNKNKLTDARTPRGNYYSLFPNIQKLMVENDLDETYDDIVEALGTKNAYARSFPMYMDYTGTKNNPPNDPPKAGYWGYLSDIYVSVKYFQSLVNKNYTLIRLIDELLTGISTAMCDIAQFKVVPKDPNGTAYTVIDMNFSPIYTKNGADKLMRISLGSIDSAFMKSAAFEMKLNNEAANQIIAQSASGQKLPNNYGSSEYDAKSMKGSIFSKGDRMFDRAARPPEAVQDSNNSSEKSKFSRMLTRENVSFYVYVEKKYATISDPGMDGIVAPSSNVKILTEKKIYILAENSPDFLKSILLDKNDKNCIYNNAIMPGTELTMEFLGISGITFLSQFTLDHVPSSYNYEQCVWQISGISQNIENKIWTTTVKAQARPLTSI